MRTHLNPVLICSLMALSWEVSAWDVGDDFEDYVGKIIPLTFEVARETAQIKEYTVFFDRASLAQSHLSGASEDLSILSMYLRRLKAINSCPLFPDGTLNVQDTIQQIFVASQMLNYLQRIQIHLLAYRTLSKENERACADRKNFLSYSVSEITLNVRIPNRPGYLDGMQVSFALGSGGGKNDNESSSTKRDGGRSKSFEELWEDVKGLALSQPTITFIRNSIIRKKIREQETRLRSEIVTSEKYQSMAEESCMRVQETHRETFERYGKLAHAIEESILNISERKLIGRNQFLHSCVLRFHEEFLLSVRAETKGKADMKLRSIEKEEADLRKSIQVNERLNLVLARLRDLELTPCGEGRRLLQQAQAEIALSYLFSLPNMKTLIPKAKEDLERRKVSCGGDGL